MTATRLTFAFIMCIYVVHAAADGETCITSLKRVNKSMFTNFLSQHHMAAIYFQKEGGVQTCAFLNEMERSAGELQQRGVAIGLNDCMDEPTAVPEFCDVEGVHKSLYVFSNGKYLLHVTVGALFEKSAIISNLLSLRLLNDVAIISSAKDRQQIERGCFGKCILHGSFLGIGTPEHAAFMKVAHDFKNDTSLKFVYSTRPELMFEIGLSLGVSKERLRAAETAQALVIVTCCRADGAELTERSATSHVYEGALDYGSLLSFVAALKETDVVDVGEDPNMVEVAQAFGRHRHVLVAVYDESVRIAVSQVVQQLTTRYYKIVAAVLANKEGADRVSSFVNLTANAVADVPVYCLVSKRQLRCDSTHVIPDTGLAVQRLSSMIEASTKSAVVPQHESDTVKDTGRMLPHDNDAVFTLIDAVETQDDQVAMRASHIRSSMKDWQKVPALTRQNFTNFVQFSDGRLVLFHLKKFDSTSIVALHAMSEMLTYLHGARHSGAVAAVDCYDWTDVCASESTYEYPSLRIYRSGTPSELIAVPVSIEGFATAARLATISNPVHLKTAGEISTFVTDSVLLRKPMMDAAADSFSPNAMIVIGAFDGGAEAADVSNFVHAAARRDGTSAFGMVFGALASEFVTGHAAASPHNSTVAALPAIVVWSVRRGELLHVPRVYVGNMSDTDEIERILVRASVPAATELTPATLPAVRSSGLPLVLLFAEHETDVAVDVMKQMALQQEQQQVRQQLQQHSPASPVLGPFAFAYMLRKTPGAEMILSHYWPGRTIRPALLFVDLDQGAVYRHDGHADRDGLRAVDVITWLGEIHSRERRPHAYLPAKRWLPAHPGYDFLAMIDEGFSLRQRDRLIRQYGAAAAGANDAHPLQQTSVTNPSLDEAASKGSAREHRTEL